MNLQALEVFCEVVRHQSFSRGADAAGITQSAASQLVANLERELGFRLIDRSRRPLRPTPEGEIYFPGCRDVLRRHRAILEEIHRHREEVSGELKVVSIYSTGLHTLSGRVEAFTSRYPAATIRLDYSLPDEVYQAVSSEEAEVGIVSFPRARRGLHVIPWLEEELDLVCPVDHPLARRRRVRVRQLDGIAFVAFHPGLRIRREVDRELRRHHTTVKVVGEFDNVETIKQALEISSAVSILPRPTTERETRRGVLARVELADLELRRPIGIIHRRRDPLSSVAEKFVEDLRSSPPSS